MSGRTSIEWTDATWNPMTGCTAISPGCDHCYANVLAQKRLKRVYTRQLPVVDTAANRENPFAPRFWPERLDEPRKWKTPSRVFPNSMSDPFHAHFKLEQIRAVFDVIVATPQHQYQMLTKRPERALRLADQLPWPKNLWLGVTVESPDYLYRLATLRAIPAAVRFVSFEPLLADVCEEEHALNLSGIDWVIIGGESGGGARPFALLWARKLIHHCRASGTRPFVKQLGAVPMISELLWHRLNPQPLLAARNAKRVPAGWVPLHYASRKGGDISEWPDDLRVREFPNAAA